MHYANLPLLALASLFALSYAYQPGVTSSVKAAGSSHGSSKHQSTLRTSTRRPPASSPTRTAPSTKPKYYHLRTHISPGSKQRKYDNLYVWSYHTGAGLGDAVVSPNASYAVKGYLTDAKQIDVDGDGKKETTGNQTFDLGTEFPWGMLLTNEPYACWSPVQINAGDGDPGFYVDAERGLRIGGTDGSLGESWGGWLVCDWWHGGQAQLFWRNKFYGTPEAPCPAPCGCEDVELIPEYV